MPYDPIHYDEMSIEDLVKVGHIEGDSALTKELTKKFQTRYKGSAGDIIDILKQTAIKGEWVVIIKEKEENYKGTITLEDIEELKLPPKQKAKLISKLTGASVKDIYSSLIS